MERDGMGWDGNGNGNGTVEWNYGMGNGERGTGNGAKTYLRQLLALSRQAPLDEKHGEDARQHPRDVHYSAPNRFK